MTSLYFATVSPGIAPVSPGFAPASPGFGQPISDKAIIGKLVSSKPSVERPGEDVGGGLEAMDQADDNPIPEEWNVYTDESSGKTYYHNHKTGEATWIRPPPPPVRYTTHLHHCSNA